MHDPIRVLVLAGTLEARRLCGLLSERCELEVTASLKGCTTRPTDYRTKMRTGGFGGPEGLLSYLTDNKVDLLVDATHPFAGGMARNSAAVASRVQLIRVRRPAWIPEQGDRWNSYPSLESAVRSLPKGARVLAPLGSGLANRKHAALLGSRPDILFVLRTVEPVTPGSIPDNIDRVIVDRPPFSRQSEIKTLRETGATCVLARNSGGVSGRTKLDAAATLKLPVFMIERPRESELPKGVRVFSSASEAAVWIREFVKGQIPQGQG